MGEAKAARSAASPLSLMSVFRDACPAYMSCGMTYEEFWDGDVFAHRAYREAEKLRIKSRNQYAWLQGLYIYQAIGSLAPALKAFSKGRAKPYIEEPIDLFENERKEREEREARERYERIKRKVAEFARMQHERQKQEVENKGVEDSV